MSLRDTIEDRGDSAVSRRDFARQAWGTAISILRADCERTRTQRDAATAFLVRVASAGILYLSQIILARWMGGFEYGIYVFVWTWVLVLGGISSLGFNVAMIRLIPEYLEYDKPSLLRGLLLGGRLIAISFGTLVMLAGLLVLYLLGDAIDNHYVLPVYLALICIPLVALSDVQDGIGRANAWMAVALIPPYILRPLLILFTMYVLCKLGFAMEAKTAAGAAVIASWLAVITQTVLLQWRIAQSLPQKSAALNAPVAASGMLALAAHKAERNYDFRTWFKTSLPLLAIAACEIVLQNTDILVVSRYLSPIDVGIYFAAAKTMALIMFVHYAVGSAVANRFAALHARGDKSAMAAFVKDAVNWTFWPSLAAALIILALGKPLLWLFGPQFTSGYPVMFILVLGFLMRSSMGPAEFLLNMAGEQRACAINLMIAAMVNIALNLTLVPIYGLIGAAWATATSLVLVAILNYIVARRKLGLNIAIWQNLRR